MHNRLFFLFIFLLVAPATARPATIETAEAQRVYDDFGGAVSQIQVIDIASGRKNSIGSGFQFTSDGFIATNYHVVAAAIRRPESNRVEYKRDDLRNGTKGDKGVLKIIAADIVNDLAILKMDNPGKVFVSLKSSDVHKGAKLFALGNPHDIGFTIIEGTYNGYAQDSLIEKIHFSGSLNPGMSGGPAMQADGGVVGINVATSGNQISFLVPIKALEELYSSSINDEEQEDFMKDANAYLATQLLDSQKNVVDKLLKNNWESAPLGPVMVPGQAHQAMKCWGASAHEEKDPFLYYRSTCMSQDRLYIDDKFDTGSYAYRYSYIVAKDSMDTMRFYNFYENQYMQTNSYFEGREDEMTNFDCNTKFIKQAELPWKTTFCIRRYKKFLALYDMQMTMAMLSPKREGMIITLLATGLSQENALRLSERFISEIHAAPEEKPEDIHKEEKGGKM